MRQIKLLLLIGSILLCFARIGYSQNIPDINKSANDKTNLSISVQHRVVFMGNSITEGWGQIDPNFFAEKPYINSGISGQTTTQMLERYNRDVINFLPTVVVILAGTNDIAGNGGSTTVKRIQANIVSMAQQAKSNGIKVVLCSVLPVYKYPWNESVNPIDSITSLNNLLKIYAQENEMIYADYYSPMVNEQKGLKSDYTSDGVHPNLAGYKVMEPIAEEAIAKAMLLAGIDPLVTQNNVVVTNITMSPTTLSLEKKDSKQLYTRLTPLNAISDITWSSDNEAVATVNSTGLVTAKTGGTATITVFSANNNKTASCRVTAIDNGFDKFEAENATLGGFGTRLVKDQDGYSGTGFIAPFGNNGDYIQFSIAGATAGSQNITLRYAAADGATIHLFVNGTKIKQVTLANTGCWGCWTDNDDEVTLNDGNNVIKYKQDASDGGHINIDYLAVRNIRTGIIETPNDEDEIILYPNPLSIGSMKIKLPEDASQLSIFDIAGKKVYQEKILKKEFLMDHSIFKSEGLYLVNILTPNRTINKKIIVTK